VNPLINPYIFGCEGISLSKQERDFFRETKPVGFILFTRNLRDKDQITQLVNALRQTVGYHALVLIDQEGGRVERLTSPIWKTWIPPLEICQKLPLGLAKEAMGIRYQLIASELIALGIDTNCVPLGDIAFAQTHPILKNRCYGTRPEVVSEVARKVADSCLTSGIYPVLKHIPGHGSTRSDSHKTLPVCNKSLEDLKANDFQVFKELNDLSLGMTAHVLYSELDAELPATLSPKIISLIREEIGFKGLLMTDDLTMSALKGDMLSRAERAFNAGCDIILHGNGNMNEMMQVAAAHHVKQPIFDTKAKQLLESRIKPLPIDVELLEERHQEIMDTLTS